jgi:hypothetical protein
LTLVYAYYKALRTHMTDRSDGICRTTPPRPLPCQAWRRYMITSAHHEVVGVDADGSVSAPLRSRRLTSEFHQLLAYILLDVVGLYGHVVTRSPLPTFRLYKCMNSLRFMVDSIESRCISWPLNICRGLMKINFLLFSPKLYRIAECRVYQCDILVRVIPYLEQQA